MKENVYNQPCILPKEVLSPSSGLKLKICYFGEFINLNIHAWGVILSEQAVNKLQN